MKKLFLTAALAFTLAACALSNSTADSSIVPDITGNGHDITWTSAPESSPDNPFAEDGNSSIRLYGLSQGTAGSPGTINLFNGGLNEFTIEGWVKPTSLNAGTLAEITWPGGKVMALGLAAGSYPRMLCGMGGPLKSVTSSVSVPSNTWSHIAGVYKDATMRIYINGVEMASAYAGAILPGGGVAGLVIGGGGSLGMISGWLDDIRISKMALPASELGFHKSFFVYEPDPISLADAKRAADGTAVNCSGYVSAKFGSYFYVVSANRISGVRVVGSDSGLVMGQEVRITGEMDTLESAERCINATGITGLAGSKAIAALGMANRAIGGGSAEGQPGVAGGIGLNNIGLLVRTTGRVTDIGGGRYTLDDGSGVSLVAAMSSGSMTDESYVAVTGISSCEKLTDGSIHRLMLVSGDSDVTVLATAPTDVVTGGVVKGVIVTNTSPSAADVFAAEELQVYLAKITGATVPIVAGAVPSDKPAIVVGDHPDAAATKAELQAFSNDQEAFAIVSKGRRLFIVGNGETAVSYAAWEWLESLGVRWLLPTVKGEYIPQSPTVSISPVNEFETPAMSYRGPSYSINGGYGYPNANIPEHGYTGSLMFSTRMRLNKYTGIFRSDVCSGVGSGHSYQYYLSPSTYYASHPEWFNLIGGQRLSSGQQVCFTNREAANEFAKNLLVDIRYQVSVGLKIDRMQVCVSPNDWYTWCECPNCQSLADYDPDGNLTSATSMVVNFANMVAEEVLEEFPTAKIVFYAYDNYTRPPTKVMPGPGVCTEFVFWTWGGSAYANHAHPMFSDENSRYRNYFGQWAQMCAGISSYEYYGHYNLFTPWPKITQMSNDMKEMVKNPKFYGMVSQSQLHWGTQAPNFYLHPKLMWNPDLDVDAVLDDYYAAGYGPAASTIKQYFETLQAKMDSLAYMGGNITEIPNLLTPEVIAVCSGYIDSAESLLSGMETNMRWRTELVIDAWRYSVKMADAMRVFVTPTGNKIADRSLIKQNLAELVTFANSQDGLWAFDNATLKYAIQGIYFPINTDLGNLPLGQHTYSDYLWWGGSLKFYSDITGLVLGPWGIYQEGGAHGVIDLPISAVSGRRIVSLVVNVAWAGSAPWFAARISVVKQDGSTVVVAPDLAHATGDVTIPANLLGQQQVRLKLECDNLLSFQTLALSNFVARITVQ